MGRPPMSAVEPKVEPYPSPEMSGLSQAPQMAYGQSSLAPSNTGYDGYDAAALGSQQHHSRTPMAYSDSQMSPTGTGNDHSNRYSMASQQPPLTNPYFPPTGQAGPLPSKANLARQSYQGSSGGLAPALSPGMGMGMGPGSGAGSGSVSGSSSSGRPLPGPHMQTMSESGTNDSKNIGSES
jgi:hypothetical protein